ncbi:glycoside hydrolase family 125 protein [Alicyclobacillus sp. SP_1]|uniref:glycoside hydrolase family 125 protein n=1 Tax=Alicyclobacillus sp. SP_1 TaxID=2942475 RepID=UPI002157A108|nr:glycoside hydrolase family 125 protein [Alicyclobacillus sp. SP_1]
MRSTKEMVAERLSGWEPLNLVFKQAFSHTLDTTVRSLEDGTTFVITGDIPAMWLRDSAAQVRPYVTFAADDPELARLIKGVIKRQFLFLLIDPYANAFNSAPDNQGHREDQTMQSPWIWERKFELDSLCYPVQLCVDYIGATEDFSVLDETVHMGFARIIQVMRTEQKHDKESRYSFVRHAESTTDTLPFGTGTRTNFTGMVWSGFRPSDDACQFGYLIPSNMFAVVILRHMAKILRSVFSDFHLASEAEMLANEIDFGIQVYGMVDHSRYGRIYAYETDGYGNYNLMDDANVPSLLSIPYIGYRDESDPVYMNTRRFVLSEDNPYYYSGKYAKGVGSPHTPEGYVWPIALIMQGLTSSDQEERESLLRMLVSTTAGTNMMHESFDASRPENYTRPWFSWANSLFCQFVLNYIGNMGN